MLCQWRRFSWNLLLVLRTGVKEFDLHDMVR